MSDSTDPHQLLSQAQELVNRARALAEQAQAENEAHQRRAQFAVIELDGGQR